MSATETPTPENEQDKWEHVVALIQIAEQAISVMLKLLGKKP